MNIPELIIGGNKIPSELIRAFTVSPDSIELEVVPTDQLMFALGSTPNRNGVDCVPVNPNCLGCFGHIAIDERQCVEHAKRGQKLPTHYIITDKATILFWSDTNKTLKTIIKRTKGDKHNKRLAFLTAYFQHYSGLSKNQANKYLDGLEEAK